MAVQDDRLVHWLLGGFELQSSVVHVGQYCGHWRASTAGQAQGSFHLVLSGRCQLNRPGRAPLQLDAGDSVFLLRDLPHSLTPVGLKEGAALACQPMRPFSQVLPDATGLACGFFGYRGATATLLLQALPDLVLLLADDAAARPVAQLFGLIRTEAQQHTPDPEAPSPLLGRLVETLFFYVMREVAQRHPLVGGSSDLWALSRDERLAPLLPALLNAPQQDWSLERMAEQVHLSRAAFCRRFTEVSGHSPAEFVQRLRMHLAARRLSEGATVELAAAEVGYSSQAAFSRSFHRLLGTPPGQWRSSQRQPRPTVSARDPSAREREPRAVVG